MRVTTRETAYPDVSVKSEMFKHFRCEAFIGWSCNSCWQLTARWQFTLGKCTWLVILFLQLLTCHIASGLLSLPQRTSIFKSHPHADRKWMLKGHIISLCDDAWSLLSVSKYYKCNMEGKQTRLDIFFRFLSSTEWTLKLRRLFKILGLLVSFLKSYSSIVNTIMKKMYKDTKRIKYSWYLSDYNTIPPIYSNIYFPWPQGQTSLRE